jgi:hypothetical protein
MFASGSRKIYSSAGVISPLSRLRRQRTVFPRFADRVALPDFENFIADIMNFARTCSRGLGIPGALKNTTDHRSSSGLLLHAAVVMTAFKLSAKLSTCDRAIKAACAADRSAAKYRETARDHVVNGHHSERLLPLVLVAGLAVRLRDYFHGPAKQLKLRRAKRLNAEQRPRPPVVFSTTRASGRSRGKLPASCKA